MCPSQNIRFNWRFIYFRTPVIASITAYKSGHALNLEAVKKLYKLFET